MENTHRQPQSSEASSSHFTVVDSVAWIVSDILQAGYSAYQVGGGFRTDMPDEVYRTFMEQRGFARDE